MSEWRDIATAPHVTWVLIDTKANILGVALARLSSGRWVDTDGAIHFPKEWMPLPHPPAGGATAGRDETTATVSPGDAIESIISQATGST
jgi:hypothetical protein